MNTIVVVIAEYEEWKLLRKGYGLVIQRTFPGVSPPPKKNRYTAKIANLEDRAK